MRLPSTHLRFVPALFVLLPVVAVVSCIRPASDDRLSDQERWSPVAPDTVIIDSVRHTARVTDAGEALSIVVELANLSQDSITVYVGGCQTSMLFFPIGDSTALPVWDEAERRACTDVQRIYSIVPGHTRQVSLWRPEAFYADIGNAMPSGTWAAVVRLHRHDRDVVLRAGVVHIRPRAGTGERPPLHRRGG